MNQTRKSVKLAIVAMTALAIFAGPASAAIETYTDRGAWRAAAGGGTGDLAEDFNSFVGTTNYATDAGLTTGFMHFSSVESTNPADPSWSVRSETPLTGLKTVHGSPYVSLVAFSSGPVDTLISMDGVRAFGFDYSGPTNVPANEANPLTLLTSRGDEITGPTILEESSGFFGFVYTEGEVINSIRVQDLTDDRTFFGADNFEAYSAVGLAATPVPTMSRSALFFMFFALALTAALVWRKQTATV